VHIDAVIQLARHGAAGLHAWDSLAHGSLFSTQPTTFDLNRFASDEKSLFLWQPDFSRARYSARLILHSFVEKKEKM